ncbi:DUF362 domain-containing protein [Candidatus Dependentiae bacterium]|nr:DUF362 domain-containing protein [Candidatus Dependentiae bacterium]
MKKSKVAILRTKPETVVSDYQKIMKLAEFENNLDKTKTTIIKNNISWHLMFPGANTTPWQMEGTILGLRNSGYKDIVCVQNKTVVSDAYKGEKLNKYTALYKKYEVPVKFNFIPEDMKWIVYKPKGKMIVLDKIFPEGIEIPDYFIGKNVLHQPTVKCHIYTETTGSMKNAFGGLLSTQRHYCHSRIHETLVDLLRIQKEIHTGIFTVMDGTTCGNGPGPRTMIPVCKDIILASSDCVAIDAVAAKLMGFDPMSLKYIRTATEEGLGTGIMSEIEIEGDDITTENWNFSVGDNAASKVGDIFWFGPLKWLQHLMFHTPIVNLFIWASAFYHDKLWYPIKARKIINEWYKTQWGKLFLNYE